jgi:hypothetical protein
MAPDSPGLSISKASPRGLRHARCLFHPLREAAALCPRCGGTFCRECVTDEEGKLACPPCLRKLASPDLRKASAMGLFRGIVAGLTAFACLTALFFGLLRWRMNTPEQHLNLNPTVVYVQSSGQSHE